MMYIVNDKEIIIKVHKLCTIYERDEESQYESPRMSRCSSQNMLDDDNEDTQISAVQLINLLKLTNYSLQTVYHDVLYIQNHFDNLERNIKRVIRNSTKLIMKLELIEQ
ncbi:Hypothetical_protein [Hexamita inflata]|uniref:Hypothetical_protein n=1 Tax=Hexamita inflata TaxID=28002 RepID=A0AA86N9M3_9EUKA|nr:Hypothetical protein HINF_LOCUS2856 [Hexamita inflata]